MVIKAALPKQSTATIRRTGASGTGACATNKKLESWFLRALLCLFVYQSAYLMHSLSSSLEEEEQLLKPGVDTSEKASILTTSTSSLQKLASSDSKEKVKESFKSPVANDEVVKESILPSSSSSSPAFSNALDHINADTIWDFLIQPSFSAKATNCPSKPLTVIEVGMYNAHFCTDAAKNGFETHCIEPSPQNFQRVQIQTKNRIPPPPPPNHKSPILDRFHLYNVAAGDTSSGTIPFMFTGGTGDHVGEFDMWNMKEGMVGNVNNLPMHKRPKVVNVPCVTLDDVIDNKIVPTDHPYGDNDDDDDQNEAATKTKTKAAPVLKAPKKIENVYFLKIDTQGYEPSIFTGLQQSIQKQKIQYLLFEFWPKGMDLLAKQQDDEHKCEKSVNILNQLKDAGYTLYVLGVESHPKAPSQAINFIDEGRKDSGGRDRPIDNFHSNCMWYYNLEKMFPDEEYKMGYWSDILAIGKGLMVPNIEELEVFKDEMRMVRIRERQAEQVMRKNKKGQRFR